MAILSVFTVFFVLRQRQLRSQELNQMRQSIASDLHDDLGSIITGIASKAEVAIARKSPEKEDLENVIKDSSMALEMMRDTIWSVNPENDNIGELVDRMKDFAFNMLNHKGIPVNYKINVDREFTLKPIKRRELYLIYKEAITNILKHSEPEVVTIVMNLNKEKFDILIKNDGVMSNHRNTNNGLNMGLNMGLKTMASRAKNLNGSLKTVNENGTFEVSLKASLK